MHLHISLAEFLTLAAYLILFGFLWRTIAARLSESPVGQAMAYIY